MSYIVCAQSVMICSNVVNTNSNESISTEMRQEQAQCLKQSRQQFYLRILSFYLHNMDTF